MCLSLLLVSLAVRGQDTKTTRRVPLQAEVTHDGLSEKESKAWEIGVGGSLINWNRVAITGFRSTHIRVRRKVCCVHIQFSRDSCTCPQFVYRIVDISLRQCA